MLRTIVLLALFPLAANAARLPSRDCSALLSPSHLPVPVEIRGAPGLKVLDSELFGAWPTYRELSEVRPYRIQRHELVSSAKYARFARHEYGESLVFVPEIGNRSVPGFDGFILDSAGIPIVNYNLKTVLNPGRNAQFAAQRHAFDAIRQVQRFTTQRQWFQSYDQRFEPNRTWVPKCFSLFGIGKEESETRPTRIVVDVGNRGPFPSHSIRATLAERVRGSNGVIESIVFLGNNQEVLEIR